METEVQQGNSERINTMFSERGSARPLNTAARAETEMTEQEPSRMIPVPTIQDESEFSDASVPIRRFFM